jgi:hypothetical protein
MNFINSLINPIKEFLSPIKGTLSGAKYNKHLIKHNVQKNGSIIQKYISKNAIYEPESLGFGGQETKVLVYETLFGYYVKPINPLYDDYFEQFFGFGCGCYGFNPNIVTYVPAYYDPEKYFWIK